MSHEVGQTPPSSPRSQYPEGEKKAEGSLRERKVVWEQGQISLFLLKKIPSELQELYFLYEYRKSQTDRPLSGKDITEKVSDGSSLEASIESVARTSMQLAPLAEKRKLTPSQFVINEIVSTEETFSKAILPLADAYVLFREDFDQMMNSFGFSKLETAFLFGHVLNAATAIHTMQIKLKEVERLSNEGRGLEALNKLSQLIENQYPAYINALKEGLLVSESISMRITGEMSNQMSEAFYQFFVTHNLEIPEVSMRWIAARLITIVQRPPRWELLFKDATKLLMKKNIGPVSKELLEARKIKNEDARDARIAEIMQMEEIIEMGKPLPAWERASAVLSENGIEFNEYSREFGAIVDADDLISKSLLQPMQSGLFGDLFKDHGIDEKKIERLNAFYNEYGQLLRPLREGKIALDREVDVNQKRLLRKELTEKAKSNLSSLNKLTKQFSTLGGLAIFEALKDSTLQFQRELEGEINAKKKTGPELIELNSKLEALQELNVKLEKVVQGLTTRFEFENEIYTDLHLSMGFDIGQVEKNLIKGPIGKDPIWKKSFESQGVKASDLRKFHQVYKQYFSVFEPFYHAVNALKDDPTNIALQAQLEKTRKSQGAKIERAFEEIRSWGDFQKLEQLDSAIREYRTRLEREASLTTNPQERTKIHRKLSLIKKIGFVKQIQDSRQLFFENLR